MTLSKCKYIFCLIVITCILFANVNTVSREPLRGWYDTHFKTPYLQIYNVALAHALYFYNVFPMYLKPILTYCEQNQDFVLPLADGPFYGDKEKIKIKDHKKEDLYIYPAYTDLGMVFVVYFISMLQGQFFPIGVRMLNILMYLIILLFLFHCFYRQKRALAGLLLCSFLASHSYFMCHLYYYAFTGWGYSLPGTLLIFALLLPVVINEPVSKKELWFRISLAGIVFFIFLAIRSDIIFVAVSILFFVIIYGKTQVRKRIMRGLFTLFILIAPYVIYSNAVTYLRHYYQAKYELPPTQKNYNGTHHLVWHGIYGGLGDFGVDKGFKYLDANVEDYAKTVKPGIEADEVGYEIILREKVLSTIQKNPAWYMKILLKRVKEIFWCRYEDEIFRPGGGKKYPWRSLIFKASLVMFFILSFLLKRFKELKMYLFFIPTVFIGIFITTAAGARYYYTVLVLYSMPVVFLISFVSQAVTDWINKSKSAYA